jgi:phospholipase C
MQERRQYREWSAYLIFTADGKKRHKVEPLWNLMLSREDNVGRFLAICALITAVSTTACNNSNAVPQQGAPLHQIRHIVLMVQENRSFNDLFAGFPGANTAMEGLCKPAPHASWCKVAHEVPLKAIPLAQGSSQLGGKDICHAHACFVTECDPDTAKVCRMDGFDLIDFGQGVGGPPAKLYPYSYVKHSDVAAYWDLARQYTLADNIFFTETASSFIAHQMIISGTVALNDNVSLTDQPNAMPWGCDAPPGTHTPILYRNDRYGRESYDGPRPCFKYATMADLLDSAHVPWLFYADGFGNGKDDDFSGSVWNGFRAIRKIFYGPDWKTNISTPNTNVFSDIKGGTLPSVSWVIPTLYDSDHPASGCNGGPYWITKVVNAVGTSKYWNDTAIVVLWDDWGGWYDPAPPAWVDYTSLGFRVPMMVISPYARPGYVSHTQYDFGSILKLMEQTFNLGSLGVTDATANSMEDVFDFTQTPNKFKPAALPPVMSCGKDTAGPQVTRDVIEHDRGVPE